MLSAQWPHHAKRSGYHPVTKGLGVTLRPHRMRIVPDGISRRIVGEKLADVYQIAAGMKMIGCDRLLVIDGDYELKLIERIQRVTSAKIFAVFHQIPSVLERCLAEAAPLRIDGAVCVAKCQIPLVHSIAPPDKTWFVPHGVDCDYFTPGAARSNQPSVLCVGSHQRDFDTLRKSADIIIQAVPTASVRLVAPRHLLPPRLDLGRVELLTDLSDDQLLEEYQRAWVVLLPLKELTANNSLLEGMACGTPVVVSDVGGTRDYAGPECGALCSPADATSHGAATVDLLLDSVRREAAGRASRTRAMLCAWPTVREQLRRILN